MEAEQNFKPVCVKIWGDYACFTRPEMKVERVSYEVITPSAARAVLEAIFWKPEFDWQIRRIEVLKPFCRTSIVRNEVTARAAVRTAKGWAKRGGGFFVDQNRAQRHSLILRDVAYIIHAEPVPHRPDKGLFAKYREQFRRRVTRGQCAWQPYLGCREFSAFFGDPVGDEKPLPFSMELGQMLFDLSYVNHGQNKGEATPIFFRAALEEGVLHVPPELYQHRLR